MASRPAATVEGTVHLRPVRLGVMADCGSTDALLALFEQLSTRWGGCYCPVFPNGLSEMAATHVFHHYELDALWDATSNTGGSASLRERNLLWRGWNQYGPLEGHGRRSHEMLPWAALVGANALSVADPLLQWFRGGSAPAPHAALSFDAVASAFGTRIANYGPPILAVVNRDDPENVRHVWNSRSMGLPLIAIDEAGIPEREEDWIAILSQLSRLEEGPSAPRVILLWDLAGAWADGQAAALRRAAEAELPSARLVLLTRDQAPELRQGRVGTAIEQPFNVTMPYGVLRTSLPLPAAPISPEWRGGSAEFCTVAAEVVIERMRGQDPRLVAKCPPDPVFTDLLEHVTEDVPRVLRPTTRGYVAGVRASGWRMRLQLHRKSDVFRRLFPGGVEVGQSDEGLFQTRGGELLGGATSGALAQPAMAAALGLLADHPRGVPAQRIRQTISGNVGRWTNHLWNETEKEYSDGVFNQLMFSGLISTVLKAKCTYCRAWMYAEPEQLSQEVHCDFCGQDLRLSPIVAAPTQDWIFRLAGHLGQPQVQAMIPVLATMGQLASLTMVEGGLDSHELGLTVAQGRRSAEADIAAIIDDPAPILILGEVKGRNRIDSNDVANLEWMKQLVALPDLPTMLLFATAKDDFGDDERAILRGLCEKQTVRLDPLGRPSLDFPLVLTGRDLFIPWADDEHLWQSGSPGFGLQGIAEESCRRRLGLDSWRRRSTNDAQAELTWID